MFVKEFERSSYLIQFEIPKKAEELCFPTEDYYQHVIEVLTTYIKEIANKISAVKTTAPSQKKAEWAVRGCQDEIINLMDSIDCIMEEMQLPLKTNDAIPNSWHALYLQILKLLSECLDFIHDRHPDLFFYDQNMPAFHERSHKAALMERLLDIQKLIPEKSESLEILTWLHLPLNDERVFTFTQYYYFDEILIELRQIVNLGKSDGSTAFRLYNYLCIMNFNHPKIVGRGIQDLFQLAKPIKLVPCLIQYIHLKREVGFMIHKEGVALYKDFPSIKSQLMEFVNTEIAIRRGLIEAEAIIPINDSKDKIKTSLSLSQLAGILRVLTDKGVFMETQKERLLQFFAANVKVNGGRNASFDGLLKHFDQTGEGTINELRVLFG